MEKKLTTNERKELYNKLDKLLGEYFWGWCVEKKMPMPAHWPIEKLKELKERLESNL